MQYTLSAEGQLGASSERLPFFSAAARLISPPLTLRLYETLLCFFLLFFSLLFDLMEEGPLTSVWWCSDLYDGGSKDRHVGIILLRMDVKSGDWSRIKMIVLISQGLRSFYNLSRASYRIIHGLLTCWVSLNNIWQYRNHSGLEYAKTITRTI